MNLFRDPKIFEQLEYEIDRYCTRFGSRKDYDVWRLSRINQEVYQNGAIETLRLLYGQDIYSKKILDAGAGMGGYVVGLKLVGFDCRGIDFNPDYVKISDLRASLYGLPGSVTEASVEALPFADNEFDIVHCHDVLEHCHDPNAALVEFNRVLKPGGVVLATFINRLAFKDPHYHLPLVNWAPRRIGDFLCKKISKKDITLNPDRQRLKDMHYFYYWQARRAVFAAGFKKIHDVRSMKIKAAFKDRYPILDRYSGGLIGHALALCYSFWEKIVGQNYYWLLSK